MNKKKEKKYQQNLGDEIEKQNQDYGSNDKVKNKLKFDKGVKNNF